MRWDKRNEYKRYDCQYASFSFQDSRPRLESSQCIKNSPKLTDKLSHITNMSAKTWHLGYSYSREVYNLRFPRFASWIFCLMKWHASNTSILGSNCIVLTWPLASMRIFKDRVAIVYPVLVADIGAQLASQSLCYNDVIRNHHRSHRCVINIIHGGHKIT